MTNSERSVEKRRRYKNRIIQAMGGKCQCCGYDKYDGALELHHINPDEKEFSICDKTYIAWEKIEEELKKCILVCANCHREIEAELIDKSLLSSSFDKIKYDIIQQEINNIKTGQKKYCPDCGKEITLRAERCPECSYKAVRVCERPSRDELKEKIRTMSFLEIGRQYGVSDNGIRRWCDSYKLPKTKKDIKSYSDKEWILI